MNPQGMLALLVTLLISTQSFAQTTEPVYTDIHLHSAIKPFNSRSIEDAGLWNYIEHSCKGRLAGWMVNGSKEIPRFSQSNFEALAEGNVRLGFLCLTPLEKRMLSPRLLNKTKKGSATASCVSGLQFEEEIWTNDEIDYFDDLAKNIRYVQDNEGKPHIINGEDYTYELVKDAAHLKEILEDPNKLAIILSIEGGHSLSHSFEKEKIEDEAAYESLVLDNVRRLKGTKPLFDDEGIYLEAPVFYLGLNHFFWNGLGGHAKTFGFAEQLVFGQKEGLNTGMTELGKKVINLLVDESQGRRIIVDTKHMSLACREWYYNFLDTKMLEGDTIPVMASHAGISEFCMADKEYQSKDKKKKCKDSYLNTWQFSLAKEDIEMIYKTKGQIGLILDKYRLMGPAAAKMYKDIIPGSVEQRDFYMQVIFANLFQIVSTIGEKDAWTIVSFGSDFDGAIIPFDTYPSSDDFPQMAKDMLEFLENPVAIFDLFSVEEINEYMYGQSPGEIINLIFSDNALNFALRNLPVSETQAKK